MEDYRGIIITCILGILLIGIFLTAFKPKESFSELYFEDHKNLPNVFFVNESQKIAFTVVSHEEKSKNYAARDKNRDGYCLYVIEVFPLIFA